MTLTEMVKNKTVKFKYYRENELWYVTEDGFEFPVPISDTGLAVFQAEDKAMLFMRWIRKQLDKVKEWEAQKAAAIDPPAPEDRHDPAPFELSGWDRWEAGRQAFQASLLANGIGKGL